MITKMITCWKITLSNNKKLYFTDYDQNQIFEEEEYLSKSCFTPNSIISSNELGQDNFTISGVIDDRYITKESLTKGQFVNAYLEIFLLDLSRKTSVKKILKTGWLGETRIIKNSFVIEVSSLSNKTNNIIGKCYSTSCRAEFGDKFCKKIIEDFTFPGEISSVLSNNSFIDSSRNEPDEYFSKGIIIFLNDQYQFSKYNVLSFYNKTISIDSNLKLKKGDRYKIIVGCDKSLESCIIKFNNALNFRGEPYIPGQHKLLACNK